MGMRRRRDRTYVQVCDEIKQKVVDSSIKVSAAAFKEVKEYLREHHLFNDQGKRDTGDEVVKACIRRKAQRLGDMNVGASDLACWLWAEAYVRQFYENISPAVEGNPSDFSKVVQVVNVILSLQNSPPFSSSMVNCFEAALGIYFLNSSAVEECPSGELHLQSEAEARQDGAGSSIPGGPAWLSRPARSTGRLSSPISAARD